MAREFYVLGVARSSCVVSAPEITIQANFDDEDHWMEVAHDHKPGTLAQALKLLRSLGLAVIPDAESRWDIGSDVTRCYLVEDSPF
ncbi:hypothetical protein OG474_30420 [Kribbella sp. NBC_01505]|uniref:hypothetical protein n=1 Tax=Kribbella sp. NBC_01505 TaxID=2903580 RepID=UPI0038679669